VDPPIQHRISIARGQKHHVCRASSAGFLTVCVRVTIGAKDTRKLF
jgi:hypothetical protein